MIRIVRAEKGEVNCSIVTHLNKVRIVTEVHLLGMLLYIESSLGEDVRLPDQLWQVRQLR